MQRELDGDRAPAEIADCVYRNGFALVRGCYPAALIARIVEAATARYAHDDRLIAQGALPPNHFRVIPLEQLVIDGSPAPTWLVDDRARFVTGICLETIAPTVKKSYVRYSHPDKSDLSIPFHQDTRILEEPLVNFWIPLAACGRDIPGLEIVTERLWTLEPTMPPDATDNGYRNNRLEIDADAIAARYGATKLWHPEFAVGDALIFLGTTIHRTHVTPAMRDGRLSIDLRLTR